MPLIEMDILNFVYDYIVRKPPVLDQRGNQQRCFIIDLAMDYCRANKVDGSYAEFGVYQGKTFQYAFHSAKLRKIIDMKFYALDSFQGFSKPKGKDDVGIINKGARYCSEGEFKNNLETAKVDMDKVEIIPGWFNATLSGKGVTKTKKVFGKDKIAIAYFDADLYEPSIQALKFATKYLVDGSVLIFDNWYLFKGSPWRGERKAFNEWSKTLPKSKVELTQFRKFGWHGNSFIYNIK